MYTNFQTCTNQFYHLNDKPELESIRYLVKKHAYEVSYGAKDQKKLKQKEESVCRIQDERQVSLNTYSNLVAIEPHLPRVWAISERRKQIIQNIAKLVSISIIDIQIQAQVDPIEESDITEIDIVENVVQLTRKCGYRSIINILKFIILKLIEKKILNFSNISIRISGDGCNVDRKVKHVLITFNIIDNLANIHKPKHHYTIVLYSGAEDYYFLKNSTRLLNNEFSNWKFLSFCLEFNAPNSTYFCLWYTISKKKHGNLNQEWTIEKNIEVLKINLNTYPGYQHYLLFNMIPLDYWIVDELHLMLCITDWLWDLVLTEIKTIGLFNNTTREIIEQEINKIGIHFQF
ncbi:37031_t:CDS:2 [Gigaspora margarita]|uniref:37031_t:CDS:1 n=1 Tax=Gigaspora margarita TaxID=4874 RepID=A0ABN7V6F5_GIGMA|nr:37031_t:CDS:2 [Gigaspora margarita]